MKLGGGSGSERDRVLGVEEGEALPDKRAGFHSGTEKVGDVWKESTGGKSFSEKIRTDCNLRK